MKLLPAVQHRFINLPLRTKLVLVFTFTMLMVGFVNVYMQISINSVVSTIDKVYASNISLNQLINTLDAVQDNMFRYLNTKSTSALNDYYVSEQSYSEQIASLNDRAMDKELKISEKTSVTSPRSICGSPEPPSRPSAGATWSGTAPSTRRQESYTDTWTPISTSSTTRALKRTRRATIPSASHSAICRPSAR